MNVGYIIGVPGSGKSTLMAEATRILGTPVVYDQPVAHLRWGDAWEIGRRRAGGFSGTDALAMNINPKAIAWMLGLAESGMGPEVLFGEGDRLANSKFLDACPNLTLFHVDTPLDVARERAESRARALGVPAQNDSWWKGRATKTANLLARYPHIDIDAEDPRPFIRWMHGDP